MRKMRDMSKIKTLLIGLLTVTTLLLIGFLLNHIIMFVDFFTVKNTIITILIIYVIIANWVYINLQIKILKKDYDFKLYRQEGNFENSRLADKNRSLKEEIADLKGNIAQYASK